MPESRFEALETDETTAANQGKKPKITIEEIVDHMARNGIASIHVEVPTVRANDGYKEARYKVVNHKK